MEVLMSRRLILKSISGFISSLLIFCSMEGAAQDTLRTYGPRFGIDIARLAFLFTSPKEKGAEASVDFEVYKNLYSVAEIGYNNLSFDQENFNYFSSGLYGRIGVDYNFLPVQDRSVHHSIFIGTRYGISFLQHRAEKILVGNSYWGDYLLDEYQNNLTGHWVELTGGVKAELFSNFFMGWTVRYKFLIDKGTDELMTPYLIHGFGKGNSNRSLGISYCIMYKIPVVRK